MRGPRSTGLCGLAAEFFEMQPTTMLLRQVHPSWVKNGHILSLAFRPSKKDEGLLSVYDGDQIQPGPLWFRYTQILGFASAGVWAATVAEANACDLSVYPDPLPPHFPEHVLIDFTKHAEKQRRAKSKILAAKAEQHGCLFAPTRCSARARPP
jgi:hypothetical protein